MSKRLLLLRHAKSDWDADYGPDHDRPLSERGRRDARRIGVLIAGLRRPPQRIVSSSARRARDTVELAMRAGGWSCEVELTRLLYGASADELLQAVHAAPDDVETLLLAGHEPTWSLFAELMIGGGRVRLPTAALARIDFEIGRWSEATPGLGTLRWLVTPKLLGGLG